MVLNEHDQEWYEAQLEANTIDLARANTRIDHYDQVITNAVMLLAHAQHDSEDPEQCTTCSVSTMLTEVKGG